LRSVIFKKMIAKTPIAQRTAKRMVVAAGHAGKLAATLLL
jgi:hypothetical protein